MAMAHVFSIDHHIQMHQIAMASVMPGLFFTDSRFLRLGKCALTPLLPSCSSRLWLLHGACEVETWP